MTQVAHPPQRPHISLGTVTLGVLLLAAGVLGILDRADVIDIRPALLLPMALSVVGLALMVGAWEGEHGGLIVLGVFLAIFTLLAALTPVTEFSAGVGERTFRPATVSVLEPDYELGIGQLRLDLTRIDFTADAVVDARVGVGELIVIVPDDVVVEVAAESTAGEVELFGTHWDGVGVEQTRSSGDGAHTLTLNLDVGLGRVEVRR